MRHYIKAQGLDCARDAHVVLNPIAFSHGLLYKVKSKDVNQALWVGVKSVTKIRENTCIIGPGLESLSLQRFQKDVYRSVNPTADSKTSNDSQPQLHSSIRLSVKFEERDVCVFLNNQSVSLQDIKSIPALYSNKTMYVCGAILECDFLWVNGTQHGIKWHVRQIYFVHENIQSPYLLGASKDPEITNLLDDSDTSTHTHVERFIGPEDSSPNVTRPEASRDNTTGLGRLDDRSELSSQKDFDASSCMEPGRLCGHSTDHAGAEAPVIDSNVLHSRQEDSCTTANRTTRGNCQWPQGRMEEGTRQGSDRQDGNQGVQLLHTESPRLPCGDRNTVQKHAQVRDSGIRSSPTMHCCTRQMEEVYIHDRCRWSCQHCQGCQLGHAGVTRVIILFDQGQYDSRECFHRRQGLLQQQDLRSNQGPMQGCHCSSHGRANVGVGRDRTVWSCMDRSSCTDQEQCCHGTESRMDQRDESEWSRVKNRFAPLKSTRRRRRRT